MEKNNTNNNNKYILITGATGGLGKAFCSELIKSHDNIFLTGTSNEKLGKLKDELSLANLNAQIKYLACDLSCYESRNNLIQYLH